MKIKLSVLALAAALSVAGAASAQGRGGGGGPPFADLVTGEQIYKGICQGCHMPDAKGAAGAGAYPALASNERLGTAEYPMMVVLAGQKAMPPFGDLLDDAQVAAVVGYVRTNFGNRYRAPVTAEAVKTMRAAVRH